MKKLMLQLLLACTLVLAVSSAAMATGTAAGTTITNTATVNYQDMNGVAKPAVTASVSVTVIQVYGVTVAPKTDAKSALNNAYVSYAITITNTGNGDDSFDLSDSNSGAWTPTSVTFYSDAGLTTVITNTGTITEDNSKTVYMKVVVSGTAIDGDTAVTRATATSHNDTNATKASDYGDYTTTCLGTANLTATKTSSTAVPVDGNSFTYTITLTNNGTKDAAGVVVTDPIPANTTYKSATITLNGSGQTDAGGDDSSDYNVTTGGAVTVNVGTIARGATATVTFQVTVNNGVANGTAITNTASVNYTAGTSGAASTSASVTVNAQGVPLLTLGKLVNGAATANAKPGDTLTYTITATNTGQGNATNVVISDPIPANTTYKAGTLKLNGVGKTDAQDSDGVYFNAGTVTTDPATIAPGATLTVEFQATVN